jgi:hypothetical protein
MVHAFILDDPKDRFNAIGRRNGATEERKATVHHRTNELASLVKSVFRSKGRQGCMKRTRHSQRAVVGGKARARRLTTLYGN